MVFEFLIHLLMLFTLPTNTTTTTPSAFPPTLNQTQLNGLPSPLNYLQIANALGDMTYFLGALLYGLPLPVYGLKKWGPTLIKDGIYIMLWSTLYFTIISIVEQVGSDLGISWNNYYNWLYGTQLETVGLFVDVNLLNGILSKFYINFAPLSLASFFLSLGSSFLTFLIALSLLVYENWGWLTAFGIMLMAIPFRLGRTIGATLIAFSIVFWVGLPLLPNFLSLIHLNTYNINNWASIATPAPGGNVVAWVTQDLLPSFIVFTLLGPLTFMTLLTAITTGLAELIGGYAGKIPFGIDIIL